MQKTACMLLWKANNRQPLASRKDKSEEAICMNYYYSWAQIMCLQQQHRPWLYWHSDSVNTLGLNYRLLGWVNALAFDRQWSWEIGEEEEEGGYSCEFLLYTIYCISSHQPIHWGLFCDPVMNLITCVSRFSVVINMLNILKANQKLLKPCANSL